jgi:branched-chain amino acid transport system permease protein
MLSQLILNGIIAGGQYSLVAIGFSLIYRTSHFLHFTHGAIYVLGAYITYFFTIQNNMPFLVAVLLSLTLCCCLGLLVEMLFYRRLRVRRASPTVLFLTSLGLFITVQNTVSLVWGDEIKSIRSGPVKEGMWILNAAITPVQLLGLLVSTGLSIAVLVLLSRTRFGRQVRAVSDDTLLSQICGISSKRIILVTLILGSFLAGAAGILKAMDSDMTPTMGFNALLIAVVAIVAGGLNSTAGSLIGAYFVGLAEQLGVWFLPTQWQQAVVFGVLLLWLLFRPEGILGTRMRTPNV